MTIEAKNINLRTVNIQDAAFIYNIRQDTLKSKYLSKINGTVNDQIKWIEKYKIKEQNEEEFYFIIESKSFEPLGLVRVYDFKKDINSFCWGSWLIKENAPLSTAIESALQIYEFAFNSLHFTQSHFEVIKENKKVVAFHQRFGAKIIDENNLEYIFTISKENYDLAKQKYKRYL